MKIDGASGGLRVVLLNTKQQLIKVATVTQGTPTRLSPIPVTSPLSWFINIRRATRGPLRLLFA
jgi:hypothetical protein